MNVDMLVDAIGQVEDELLEDAERVRCENKTRILYRPWLVAAAMVLVVGIGVVIGLIGDGMLDNSDSTLHFYDKLDSTGNMLNSNTIATQGVYLEGELYVIDFYLSNNASSLNVGEAIAEISINNLYKTDILAYEYIPKDGETKRIIIAYKNKYYVYQIYTLNKD